MNQIYNTNTEITNRGNKTITPMLILIASAILISLSSIWAIYSSIYQETAFLLIALSLLTIVGALLRIQHLIKSQYLESITNITAWAKNLNSGTLQTRLTNSGENGLDNLSLEANSLSDKFQALSEDMNSQVQSQTKHIAQKTRSLEIIYDVAASINISRDLDDLLTRFLHTLRDVVKARAAVVRLVNDDGDMRLVASTGLKDEVIEREQLIPSSACLCGSALDNGQVQYQYDIKSCDKIIGYNFFEDTHNVGMIAVPLQYRGKTLGVYNLFVDEKMLSDIVEFNELLTSIGRHLGMAIDKARLDDESNRTAIVEERTRLAHELHDSLAQTIASLRFQARVLDENLRKGDEPAVWHELEMIENNLDEANAELRELITHFRAPIDKRGLVPAVEHLISRFQTQTGIHTFLQKEWNIDQIKPAIEVEVLRIIQESLNNIRKHSHAHTVRVLLRNTANNDCHILIEDDGVGLDATQNKNTQTDHYGLHIMTERAKRINGNITLESDTGEGTRVTLKFNPFDNTIKHDLTVKIHPQPTKQTQL